MVSEKQSRRIPSLGSKRYLGVKKQASNRLKYMIKRMNAHDSILLKSYIQREVRDGVERKFQELLISSGLQKLINALKMKDQDSLQELLFSREKINQAGRSGARFLELRFTNDNKLPMETFTKTNIIPKDEQFQIALFDVRSKSIVNDGPFSSMKIEICPIKSVFECCDDDDWTENEFKDNILHQRENKEPLLVGDRFVTLENGVASISRIVFTDNTGWVKNKKFSLGARAMENGENIKEGRSQAFRVKDVRGESYKKHYHPYLKLKDAVWRLEKIAENGKFHQRLNSKGIHTVKDLLRLLIINESSLREKFGKIQNKCWLAIVEHARSCVVDDYMLYCCYGMSTGQPVLLLFNVIYELVGVTFDEQKFYLPDDLTLTPYQKNLVEIVKQDAYKNIEKLNVLDEGILNSRSLEARIKSTREQDLQHIDISAAQGYGEPFISSSNVNHGIENAQINVDPVPDIREVPFISSCDVLNDNFERADWSTLVDLLKSDMEISNNEKPKAVWRKIRAVVKWIIIVRRVVAAKRNEHVFVYKVYDISAIF